MNIYYVIIRGKLTINKVEKNLKKIRRLLFVSSYDIDIENKQHNRTSIKLNG